MKYNLKQYWEQQSKTYSTKMLNPPYAYRILARQEYLSRIMQWLKVKSFHEIGCGFGWNIDYISRRTGIYGEGSDWSEGQIEEARRIFPNHNFIISDATKNIEICNKAGIDALLSVTCFQHIKDAERVASNIKMKAEKYIILLELDKDVCKRPEKRKFSKTGVHFFHDYRKLFANWKLIWYSDYSKENDRAEPVSIFVFAKGG